MTDDKKIKDIREMNNRVYAVSDGSLPLGAATIKFLLSQLGTAKKVIEQSCTNDAEIRDMARSILGDFEVDGDSYEVPTTAMIVERLLKFIDREKGIW